MDDYVHESTLPDEIKYARRYLVNTIFVGANDEVKVDLLCKRSVFLYQRKTLIRCQHYYQKQFW